MLKQLNNRLKQLTQGERRSFIQFDDFGVIPTPTTDEFRRWVSVQVALNNGEALLKVTTVRDA